MKNTQSNWGSFATVKPQARGRSLFVLALAVIIICPAFAQSEGDFNVKLLDDDSGVVITGYTGRQRAVIIPAKIQGYPVKEIGDKVFKGTYITSITIPTGVVRIGSEAFLDSDLTSVSIPASITKIGYSAFENCKSLATVNFSEGLVEIEGRAFNGCRSLKTVKLPNSLTRLGGGYDSGAFEYSGLTAITLGTGLTEIPEYVFNSTPIKTIVVPEGVTVIDDGAFYSCTALTTVTLPSTLLAIGSYAFFDCSALTTINIPDTLTSVKFFDNAFKNCPKLLLATRAALKKLGWIDK